MASQSAVTFPESGFVSRGADVLYSRALRPEGQLFRFSGRSSLEQGIARPLVNSGDRTQTVAIYCLGGASADGAACWGLTARFVLAGGGGDSGSAAQRF